MELYSERRQDHFLVLRGVVTIPMVHPDTAKKYDLVKQKNIFSMQKRQKNIWGIIKIDAQNIFKKSVKDLIKFKTVKGEKHFSVQSALFIEGLIYDEFGMEKYPRDVVKLMVILNFSI